MAYREQRDLSGVLFRNEEKTADNPQSASWCDAKGRCSINGQEYYISAWTKLDKNGNKYQSLAFKAANDQRGPAQPRPARPQANQSPQQQAEDDPSCPF